MPISELCNREVVIVHPDDTVLEAALLMRQHHVGDVVVVEDRGDRSIPIGIVTDRDLVVEIMTQQLDPAAITVRDMMASDLVTVKENVGMYEAIKYMHVKGVRRLPVVDDSGELVGILSLDDLVELLTEEMATLAKLVKHEQKIEASIRP
jgi:CBS domain-containing protein